MHLRAILPFLDPKNPILKLAILWLWQLLNKRYDRCVDGVLAFHSHLGSESPIPNFTALRQRLGLRMFVIMEVHMHSRQCPLSGSRAK